MTARTALQKQRRAENERRRYTQRRLAAFREAFPGLPTDSHMIGLRQLSACVRKAGSGQATLRALFESSALSGPFSKEQESPDTTLSPVPRSELKACPEDAAEYQSH